MKLKNALLLLSLLLTSCSSIDSYNEPAAGSQPLATVVSSYSNRTDLTNWYVINLSSIDNKSPSTNWSGEYKLIPGPHLFVVQYEYHRGSFLNSQAFDGVAQVNATVRAGMKYHFMGQVDGAYLKVWVEDNMNRKVSNVALSNYTPEKIQPMYMPVIINTGK